MHYTTDRSQVRLKRKDEKEKIRGEKDYVFQRQFSEKPCTTPVTAHRCV